MQVYTVVPQMLFRGNTRSYLQQLDGNRQTSQQTSSVALHLGNNLNTALTLAEVLSLPWNLNTELKLT